MNLSRHSAARSPRILLVDDSSEVRKLLREFLEELSFEVQTARNGAQAFDLWTTDTPDLLITDVKMPKMDGITLVKEVRQRDPHFPIVVVTAFATPELAPFETGEHPVAVLRKPFSLAKLIMRIESLGFGAGSDRPSLESLG